MVKSDVKFHIKLHSILISFLIFVFAVLLLIGCQGTQQGSKQPQTPARYIATGTEGIVVKFVPNQPPPKVYTGSSLDFLVEVRNKGTYTVPQFYLYLTGFDPRIITGLNPVQVINNLEAKSQFMPEGGYNMATFSTSSLSLPTTTPSYKPNFLLTACYPYVTMATPAVCVDPKPTDTISTKSCKAQPTYGTGSQGAPVAVSSIESTATPKEMIFRIHVQNTKSYGFPFNQNALSKCPGGLDYKDLNELTYKVTLGSGQVGQCTPITTQLKLVNDQGIIICKFPHTQSGLAYQTTLNVELRYGYKNSIALPVEIENLDYNP